MLSIYRGLICTAVAIAPLAGYGADEFIEALTGGKVSGNFRMRYEDVDVDSRTIRNASALTLRSRLGYETAPLHGLSATLEFEDTRVLDGRDNYAPEARNSALPASNPYDQAAIVQAGQIAVYRRISPADADRADAH